MTSVTFCYFHSFVAAIIVGCCFLLLGQLGRLGMAFPLQVNPLMVVGVEVELIQTVVFAESAEFAELIGLLSCCFHSYYFELMGKLLAAHLDYWHLLRFLWIRHRLTTISESVTSLKLTLCHPG